MGVEIQPLGDPHNFSKLGSDVVEAMSESETEDGMLSIEDRSNHRYECRSCGYIYDPAEGVKKLSIFPGTAFLEIDKATFRCPVCRLGVDSFKDIGPRSAPSGFEENLNYGFGINNLTPGQKNVLIFGGLAFAFACFLSLYSLH